MTIINIYTQQSPRYIKQNPKESKWEIDNLTLSIGDLKTPFSIIGRITRKNINRGIEELNNTYTN